MATAIPIIQNTSKSKSLPLVQCPDIRVMIINPPQSYPQKIASEYQSYFPVGIASLGAAIRPTGAQVKLLDCLAVDEVRLDEDDLVVWFGMGMEELTAEIQAFSPHIVGVCNAFSMFASDTVEVAEMICEIDPDIQVIVGGIEASVQPNNHNLLQRNPCIDVLVKGEGETTFRELVQNFELETRQFRDLGQTLGVLFRDDQGDVIETSARPWILDMDELPLPAYDLLDMERMFNNEFYAKWRSRSQGGRCIPIHTSRGCPYSCSFCSVHSQVGKLSRRHSPEYIARHIKFLKENYGITHVHFEDDNLTINKKHTAKLFEVIKPLEITFDTPNGIRADTVNDETAVLFKESGANYITIAVESGVQHILDKVVRKSLKLEDVITAARALDEVDLTCVAFFIIGFPGETEENIRETLRFAKRLAVEYNTVNLLFVANPLPGTPLHQECVEHEYLVRDIDKDTLFGAIRLNQGPLIKTKEFSKEKLFQWTREELEDDSLFVGGSSIPWFVSDNSVSWARMEKWIGHTLKREHATPYDWMEQDLS